MSRAALEHMRTAARAIVAASIAIVGPLLLAATLAGDLRP